MLLYNAGLYVLHFFVWVGSYFKPKAKQFVEGRKSSFEKLNAFHQTLKSTDQTFWFHCASLGEFEQARPLIEALKIADPNSKIAISFFSPSGYEIQKNYALADLVFYLPMATRSNAKKLITLLNPKKIFFIKYEFWLNYINEAHSKSIPVFLISALFNPKQLFFKWYGYLYLNVLSKYTLIFVQDEASLELLKKYDVKSFVIGDTRFDRVLTNKAKAKKNELVEAFANNKKIIVLGSSWPKEEELIFNSYDASLNYKVIIAPHDISREIVVPSSIQSVKYTEANTINVSEAEVLIIDNIGMLSSLYTYASIAFVGGGFRGALHNILEAAVFGIPVIYGPQTNKHPEAEDLVKAGGGIIIKDKDALKDQISGLLGNENRRQRMGEKAAAFIAKHAGATQKVMREI